MSAGPNDGAVDKKAAMSQGFSSSAAWDSAAEAYVTIMQENNESEMSLRMVLGRNMVADRVVSVMANKEKPVVLDVACGGGEPTLTMAKAMPHAEVHGTDFAPAMVDFIRKRADEAGASNLKAGVEDAMLLAGFGDGSVDAVTCTWGLESTPNHMDALRQFHRVLRGDGLVVFAAWDENLNSLARKAYDVIGDLTGTPLRPEMHPLGGEGGGVARKVMEDVGFVDVQVSKVDIPMYLPAGTTYRELFAYCTKPTPAEVALASMEHGGRQGVRDEAFAIFEAKMEKDRVEGNAPPGPGLPPAGSPPHDENQPVYFMEGLIVEGRKPE